MMTYRHLLTPNVGSFTTLCNENSPFWYASSPPSTAGPQMMLIGSLVLAAVLFRLYKWWKTVYTPRPPDSTPFEAIQIMIERLDAYFGSDNQWETFFTWTNAILHFRGLRAHFDLERGIHVDDLPRSRNPDAIVFVV
ncbi:hypothetical protein FRC02_004368, partial [Tulasnella sp. 418]